MTYRARHRSVCSLATRVLFCEAPIKTLFVSPLLHTNLSKSLIYSLLGKEFLPVLRISIKSSRPVFLAPLVRLVSSREGVSFSIGSASSTRCWPPSICAVTLRDSAPSEFCSRLFTRRRRCGPRGCPAPRHRQECPRQTLRQPRGHHSTCRPLSSVRVLHFAQRSGGLRREVIIHFVPTVTLAHHSVSGVGESFSAPPGTHNPF